MTTTTDQIRTGATELPLPDGQWRVDPSRSEIGFAVKDLWGLRTVRGGFGTCDGDLEVRDRAATGRLTIDARSLDSGHARRDDHLRSPDFFDVERHPQIVFTVTRLSPRGSGLTIDGELLVRTSRVPLTLPLDVVWLAAEAVTLEGRTTISRRAAGLGWNKLGMIRDAVTLGASITLVEAGP